MLRRHGLEPIVHVRQCRHGGEVGATRWRYEKRMHEVADKMQRRRMQRQRARNVFEVAWCVAVAHKSVYRTVAYVWWLINARYDVHAMSGMVGDVTATRNIRAACNDEGMRQRRKRRTARRIREASLPPNRNRCPCRMRKICHMRQLAVRWACYRMPKRSVCPARHVRNGARLPPLFYVATRSGDARS